MKKVLKGFILMGMLGALVGCRNQVNKDFLNRFVDLQGNDRMEAAVTMTNLTFKEDSLYGEVGQMLAPSLGELQYQMAIQKDEKDPLLMDVTVGIDVFAITQPLLDGMVWENQFLLDAEQYLNVQTLTGASRDYAVLKQLQEDFTGKKVALETEEIDEKALLEKMKLFRKGFLNVDPELFTETDDAISVTLGIEEWTLLLTPLMAPVEEGMPENVFAEYVKEDSEVDVTITLGKETDDLSAQVAVKNVELGFIEEISLDMTVAYSDEPVTLTVPDDEDMISQPIFQDLIAPPAAGAVGYPDAVFQEVVERVEKKRNDLNRETGRELLTVYSRLLTEEQYRLLENVIDIPTLETRYPISSYEHVTTGPHSDIGIGEERFEALLKSVEKYRDNQTKKTAQKTLDQYYSLLTAEQYQQLEEAMAIDSLPE